MKTKVFFLGTPDIAAPSLVSLNETAEIVGVGVFPDRKVGRKKVLTPCPVKAKALELQIPIYEIAKKSDLEEVVKTVDFDIAIVIAFGMIVTQEALDGKPFFNVHFSLLPKWRGASPVQSSILAGETEMGITIQRMVYKLDAGDIAWQKSYEMEGKNTAEVWEFLAQETSQELPLLVDQLKSIETVQQIESEATHCGKFEKTDGEVSFQTDSAETIYRKFLAFDPWPGVYVKTQKGNVKLIDLSLEETVDSVGFETIDRTIYLNKIQVPSKKPNPIKEVLKGIPELFELK